MEVKQVKQVDVQPKYKIANINNFTLSESFNTALIIG